ncbi:hypothetical protein ACLOJK_009601 [Asimina triloba]
MEKLHLRAASKECACACTVAHTHLVEVYGWAQPMVDKQPAMVMVPGAALDKPCWWAVFGGEMEAAKATLPDFAPIMNEFGTDEVSRDHMDSSMKPGDAESSGVAVVDP